MPACAGVTKKIGLVWLITSPCMETLRLRTILSVARNWPILRANSYRKGPRQRVPSKREEVVKQAIGNITLASAIVLASFGVAHVAKAADPFMLRSPAFEDNGK